MVLVYLLLVVNFQSWSDPFVIITALPGALAGVAWGLCVLYHPGGFFLLAAALAAIAIGRLTPSDGPADAPGELTLPSVRVSAA